MVQLLECVSYILEYLRVFVVVAMRLDQAMLRLYDLTKSEK